MPRTALHAHSAALQRPLLHCQCHGSCLYGHQQVQYLRMWSAGVAPLFAGTTDIEQLSKMRSVMGSIDTNAWQGALELPDFAKLSFAPCPARSWPSVLPHASPAALDLLTHMLTYNPGKLAADNCCNVNLFLVWY